MRITGAALLAIAAVACTGGGAPGAAAGVGALQRLPEGAETISLLGDTLRAPALAAETRARFEARLAEARSAFEHTPENADSIIWLGRRTAYLGRFRDAIAIYDRGIALHPTDARLYRHRGHRFITIRRPDLAIRDLREAAALVKGVPDQIEPDGLPNAINTPLSTLQFNIWYHLGLAHFLRGEYEDALRAYTEGRKVSRNADTRVAMAHWTYLTLRRVGRHADAAQLAAEFTPDMAVVEDSAYHRLIMMYRGLVPPDSLIDSRSRAPIRDAATGFGVGAYHLAEGRRGVAMDIWSRVITGSEWPAFGHIAAEYELHRYGIFDPKRPTR